MICRSCGIELPDGAEFCKECGTLQESPELETFVPAVETSEAPTAAEELFPEADDFDPRAFAGLDEDGNTFDPAAFAGLDLNEQEDASEEEEAAEEQPKKAKKAKKEKAPKEPKKRKAGAVVAVVLVIILVVAAAVAGLLWWLTMPLEEDILISDFTKNAQMEAGEAVLSFTIDRRDTDRLGLSDSVWCSVVTETDTVHRERTYQMTYALTTDGWQLDAVDGTDTAAWTTEPLVGISLEQLQATLIGRELEPEEDFTYIITEDDVADVEILSQDPDLIAGTDTVEASICITGELVSWTVDTTIQCSFDEIWHIDSLESAPAEIDFKPGYDFNLKDEELLKELYKAPITLGEDEDEDDKMEVIEIVEEGKETEPAAEEEPLVQTVKVTKGGVSEFTVEEGTFSLAKDRYLAKCTFVLDKGVAKLFVKATLICEHDGAKWVVEDVEYDAEVEKINLTGSWLGSYTAPNGKKPDLTVIFGTVKEDGTVENTFNFKSSETDLSIPVGCWLVTSKNDLKTMKITIEPGEWKNNPGAANPMEQVTLKGVLMIDDAVITDNSTFSIKLDRPEPVEEEIEEETTEVSADPAAEADKPADTTTETPADAPAAPSGNDNLNWDEINDPGLLGPNDLPIG